MTKLKRLVTLWLSVAVLFATVSNGCTTIRYIPVETTVTVHQLDSIYFRDTVLQVEVQKARISDFSRLLDTLDLETPLARSRAFVDTTAGILRGTLEQRGEIPVKVQWKEHIVYRDSVREREVPVPVEVEKIVKVVPWWAKGLSALGVLSLLVLAFFIGKKFF